MNPYLCRVMIRDPKDFYGRGREVSTILTRIAAERPQSVSVVGERRIGKSSLLYHLTASEIHQGRSVNASYPFLIFVDFQQLHHISLTAFFELLVSRIRTACSNPSEPGSPGYSEFQRLLEILSRENRKLVLLLDEFDAITSNPAFDREFFSFLRSMANHYPVAYLTSSQVELQHLCHSEEIADSPFFNIFSNLYLGPFQGEEALDLITRPSEREGIPLGDFAGEIMELGGLLPFYLQIACSVYFELLSEKPGEGPGGREVEKRFLEEAAPHFDYFWNHCPPEYQSVLRKIIPGEQPAPEEVPLCRKLLRSGYVIENNGEFSVFSRLFAEHIALQESAATYSRSLSPPVHLPPIAVGAQINQYRILSRAGEGGMGVVYEGEDTVLRRKVALKVIKQDFLELERSRKRFLQEARSAASLNHPTITLVHELFEYGNQIVLVMEWLEGETLKEKIQKQGPLESTQLLRWLIEACHGLEAAHRRGIIHRDIKSANLMITRDNHMKILDFGLAKGRELGAADSAPQTAKGTLLGTLDYLSPEQAAGDPVDCRSDLYSLGVVLYEGLSGKLPFRRHSIAATLYAIVHEPVSHLEIHPPAVAGKLNQMLRRLLDKNPAGRHPDASDLARELETFLTPSKRWLSWLRGVGAVL